MHEPTEGNPLAAFGANEWLVDEMYEQYLKDPESVDPAWWDFFKSYRNGGASNGAKATPAPVSNAAAASQAGQPAVKTEPTAEPKPAPTPVAKPSVAPTPAAAGDASARSPSPTPAPPAAK